MANLDGYYHCDHPTCEGGHHPNYCWEFLFSILDDMNERARAQVERNYRRLKEARKRTVSYYDKEGNEQRVWVQRPHGLGGWFNNGK